MDFTFIKSVEAKPRPARKRQRPRSKKLQTELEEAHQFLTTALFDNYRCLIGGCVPNTKLINAIDRELEALGVPHFGPKHKKPEPKMLYLIFLNDTVQAVFDGTLEMAEVTKGQLRKAYDEKYEPPPTQMLIWHIKTAPLMGA